MIIVKEFLFRGTMVDIISILANFVDPILDWITHNLFY
jgi:hypothetical protein